jgi:methylenetetrahydrofolate reductase (NADPH)
LSPVQPGVESIDLLRFRVPLMLPFQTIRGHLPVRTSIELVPRSNERLLAEVRWLRRRLPAIDTINVPDLVKLRVRSWEAARITAPAIAHRIPHIRAQDLCLGDVDRLAAWLEEASVREVLVVAGDTPARGTASGIAPLALITALARRLPGARVYAALDPHAHRDDRRLRQNLCAKVDAGASGFFSQPLFGTDELLRCLALLPLTTVFWGVSPVISPKSRRYWEERNAVRFPPSFEATLAWNHAWAIELLDLAAVHGHHAYLMPIRLDLATYLEPLYPAIARANGAEVRTGQVTCELETIPESAHRT